MMKCHSCFIMISSHCNSIVTFEATARLCDECLFDPNLIPHIESTPMSERGIEKATSIRWKSQPIRHRFDIGVAYISHLDTVAKAELFKGSALVHEQGPALSLSPGLFILDQCGGADGL